MTLSAPLGAAPGKCSVRVEFLDEPACVRQYKGKPLFNEDDMQKMTLDLPSETDLANEHRVANLSSQYSCHNRRECQSRPIPHCHRLLGPERDNGCRHARKNVTRPLTF